MNTKTNYENYDMKNPETCHDTKENRRPDPEQRETEELNTQDGNDGSTWGKTADTNNHNATGEAKLNTMNMETRRSK